MADTLRKINYFLALGVIFLTPIFFLPFTSEFYEYNKQALLIVAACASLVLWTISFVLEKQVRLTRSPLGLPFLAIAASWLLSSFLRTPNRLDAFLDPGQTSTIVSLIVLFFTTTNSIHTRIQLDAIITAFILSFAVLGGISIFWASGIASAIWHEGFLSSPLWTPTGNTFGTLTVLTAISLFLIIFLLKGRTQIGRPRFIMYLATLILTLTGAGLTTYRLFFQAPGPNRPVFLSQSASWAIALESLKSSPLLGTGPSTYLSDFTRFRPLSYNLTDTWAVRFATSSNYYLQILSTVGILGLLAYLFLVSRTFHLATRSIKTAAESSLHSLVVAAAITAAFALLAQVFIPTSIVFLSTIFFLLIIVICTFKQLGSSQVHEANINIVAADSAGIHSPLLPLLSLILAIVLVLPSLYFSARAYAAEVLFQTALNYAVSNDGKSTYETLIKAIRANPYKDTYRITYSQTNLLLANSLASGKTELTPEQRNTISQLIQQAIREAKNAVALNPAKVVNLENLAGVYRSLLPLAKGADTWTIASYRQAIQLDPVNPNLRIALGGIYYSLKNYDEAIKLFTDSVNLKPDHPNAFYNLAAAFREKGDSARAAATMQSVVNLVDKDSADYTKALSELEELRKKAGEQADQSPQVPNTELQSPQPLPTPKISPPIELPPDLGPESTPSPTPASTPTPTPTL